jgi:hypothetical protein
LELCNLRSDGWAFGLLALNPNGLWSGIDSIEIAQEGGQLTVTTCSKPDRFEDSGQCYEEAISTNAR